MTKQMGHTVLTTLVGLALGMPGAAFAGSATVTVHNHFDGEAEVWVDSILAGMVQGDSRLTVTTRPGNHRITVRRPVSNYVLASTELRLANNTSTVLPVRAPAGQLRIDNTGDVRLKAAVEGADPVWIAPGTAALVPVTTGSVMLEASIKEPRGEWKAVERTVWVEPGELGRTTLSPDPTVIIVTNRDSVPVRALLDGKDAGWIQGGETQRVWVRPGPTQVVLLDRQGAVRTTTQVTVTRGQETRLVVQPAVTVIPVASR